MLILVQGSLRELQSCNAYLFDRVMVRFLSFMFSWTWIKREYPGPSTVVRNTFKNKTKLLCDEWILLINYERILIKMHHKNDGSLWLCPFTHLIERGCFLRPVSFEKESPEAIKQKLCIINQSATQIK